LAVYPFVRDARKNAFTKVAIACPALACRARVTRAGAAVERD
jgi:hypothetical protein